MTENPADVLDLLEKQLLSEGYDNDRLAMKSLLSLRSELLDKGYVSSPTVDTDYTIIRAKALRKLSSSMLSRLTKVDSTYSYADKAKLMSSVGDSYLKLAHAFKVDAEVWTFAQNNLVPTLTLAIDETSIDAGISCLKTHLSGYVLSLDKWLS